jgi:hypothetical protein
MKETSWSNTARLQDEDIPFMNEVDHSWDNYDFEPYRFFHVKGKTHPRLWTELSAIYGRWTQYKTQLPDEWWVKVHRSRILL